MKNDLIIWPSGVYSKAALVYFGISAILVSVLHPPLPWLANLPRIVMPVLSLELAQTISEAEAVMGPSGSPLRESFRLGTFADFLFILGYTLATWLTALDLRRAGLLNLRQFMAAILGIVTTAGLDITENLAILALLKGSYTALDWLIPACLFKWVTLGFATSIIAIGLIASGRRKMGLILSVSFLFGALIIADRAFVQLQLLSMAIGWAYIAGLSFRKPAAQ